MAKAKKSKKKVAKKKSKAAGKKSAAKVTKKAAKKSAAATAKKAKAPKSLKKAKTAGASQTTSSETLVGAIAPHFSATASGGQTISSKDLAGKAYVLYFYRRTTPQDAPWRGKILRVFTRSLKPQALKFLESLRTRWLRTTSFAQNTI